MLLAIDLYEHFIDIERITIASVLSLQATSIDGTELDAPQSDRLPSDDNAPFSEQIFDIAMAEVEPVVQPDCVGDDIGRESVT